MKRKCEDNELNEDDDFKKVKIYGGFAKYNAHEIRMISSPKPISRYTYCILTPQHCVSEEDKLSRSLYQKYADIKQLDENKY